MSLQYSFVTPLTSMVVTRPEEASDGPLIADKLTEGTPGWSSFKNQTPQNAQDCLHKGYRLLSYNNTVHCRLFPVFFIEQRQHAEKYGSKMH